MSDTFGSCWSCCAKETETYKSSRFWEANQLNAPTKLLLSMASSAVAGSESTWPFWMSIWNSLLLVYTAWST